MTRLVVLLGLTVRARHGMRCSDFGESWDKCGSVRYCWGLAGGCYERRQWIVVCVLLLLIQGRALMGREIIFVVMRKL